MDGEAGVGETGAVTDAARSDAAKSWQPTALVMHWLLDLVA